MATAAMQAVVDELSAAFQKFAAEAGGAPELQEIKVYAADHGAYPAAQLEDMTPGTMIEMSDGILRWRFVTQLLHDHYVIIIEEDGEWLLAHDDSDDNPPVIIFETANPDEPEPVGLTADQLRAIGDDIKSQLARYYDMYLADLSTPAPNNFAFDGTDAGRKATRRSVAIMLAIGLGLFLLFIGDTIIVTLLTMGMWLAFFSAFYMCRAETEHYKGAEEPPQLRLGRFLVYTNAALLMWFTFYLGLILL